MSPRIHVGRRLKKNSNLFYQYSKYTIKLVLDPTIKLHILYKSGVQLELFAHFTLYQFFYYILLSLANGVIQSSFFNSALKGSKCHKAVSVHADRLLFFINVCHRHVMKKSKLTDLPGEMYSFFSVLPFSKLWVLCRFINNYLNPLTLFTLFMTMFADHVQLSYTIL